MLRLASPIFVSLVLVGCYVTHGVRSDAAIDASTTLDTALRADVSGPDASTTPDAGTDAFAAADAACPSIVERNVRMCVLTPTGTIPAGEAYTLRVTRSTCRCEARACDVRVERDRIHLDITACDTGVPCDECTNEADCVLPPLPSGTFEVVVDGVHAGSVAVEPRAMVSDASPACWAIPEAPESGLACDAVHVEIAPRGEACFRRLEDVGTFVRVQLEYECASCLDWSGGCEAVRTSRRQILLRPRIQRCECGDCPCDPDLCVRRTVTCETPPLRDGRYEIDVEDSTGTLSTLGAVDVVDVDVPDPVTCTPMP